MLSGSSGITVRRAFIVIPLEWAMCRDRVESLPPDDRQIAVFILLAL
jgi:hypothetical protein